MTDLLDTDRRLVRRLRNGDEEAFDEFFERMFPRVYRFALPRVARREDAAEDVAQATLCRAIRRLETWRGEASLFTWICTICRHEIEAWRRAHPEHQALELLEESPEFNGALESLHLPAPNADAALAQQELAALVHRVLDHLPTRYGNVLEWKYLDEAPVREIAARLDVSEKAAESLLTRARAAFRDVVLSVAPALEGLRREVLREQ